MKQCFYDTDATCQEWTKELAVKQCKDFFTLPSTDKRRRDDQLIVDMEETVEQRA